MEVRLDAAEAPRRASKELLREFGRINGENVRGSRDVAKRAERGKAYYMISAVSQKYDIHPQTLRLYEREGLLKPSRTEGNTRLYSEEDLEQLETILTLTRDLGVNLAGVEIILNMRRKIEQMQGEVNEFMDYVKRELARGIDDWEQRLGTALVKSSPTDLVRRTPPAAPDDEERRREPQAPDQSLTFVRARHGRAYGVSRSCSYVSTRSGRFVAGPADPLSAASPRVTHLEVGGRQRAERRVQDAVVPARVERAADVHVRAVVGDDQPVPLHRAKDLLHLRPEALTGSWLAFSRSRAPIGSAPVVDPARCDAG